MGVDRFLMDKILSYDIEIYDDIPEGLDSDLSTIRPSIAALCADEKNVEYFYDEPYPDEETVMSKETAKKLVKRMMEYYEQGYTVFGWNTVAFDFPLIAYYSGAFEECGNMALNSIDGMLLVTFRKGYFLGLDAALRGARLASKIHEVKLNDGTVMMGMGGQAAPKMWRDGEYEAVKEYLAGDVIQPLKLCNAIEKGKGISWTSKTGRYMFVPTPLLKVKELFKLPEPDTSWQTSPIKPRSSFVEWIPKNVLEANGVLFE